MNGLVLGKFYPPHIGHHYLIDEAQKRMEERGGQLIVLVACAAHESLPLVTRCRLIKERHPGAVVLGVHDNHPIDYDDAAVWDLHEGIWRRALGPYPIDYVFSSEKYGPELARRLDAEHDTIDLGRSHIPISATMVRESPPTFWNFLAPATKAELVKRVVVIGPESSGTTTLALDLASHFRTPWVPEWGRLFSESLPSEHEWTTDDFDLIAQNQMALEDDLAERSRNGLLICDTDLYATRMFHELYLGRSGPRTLGTWRPADLYLITDHRGITFRQDGTRLFEHKRDWMLDWLLDHLPMDRSVMLGPSSRQQLAMQEVQALQTRWNFPDPLG